MFLLDTNVVSELRKVPLGRADPRVAFWDAQTATETTFISAVTIMELEIGVARLELRDATQGGILRRWFEGQVLPAFRDRVLAIDAAVARRCTLLHVPDRRTGNDAFIAATALVHGLTVVTRNLADFAPMGVPTLNPWEYAA